MTGGAIAVLVTGEISLPEAIRAINFEVLFFLFGMFVVGVGLEESGYLFILGQRVLKRAKNSDQLVVMLIFSFGFFSAILMNDTLAIIGTPLVLYCAQKFRISPRMLLLVLCCAITTGSVMSPIGNPQNLLIASYSGLDNPFLTFFLYLAAPTLLSLAIVYLLFRWLYRQEFGKDVPVMEEGQISDPQLARVVRVSLAILLILIAARTAAPVFPAFRVISLPLIALLSASPLLLFSRKRATLIRLVDWPTMIFFVAMFVLMGSVWQSGIFQSLLRGGIPDSVLGILALSVIISQFISNVPFVALFQPLLVYQGIPLGQTLALAAGSTLAGNLTILGAASNVIVIQNAERRGETLTFLEFLRVGVPLTLIQVGIFSLFLALI
ncbi:MAG: anion transporter [Methanomicrobiales archaeon]|nr:anion transporter [Methanomicrobiales archaeon]